MIKTALITGASSGIGMELAKIHAKNGDNLILVARSEKKLTDLKEELEKKYNNSVLVIVKDLSLPGAVQEVFHEVKDHSIHVDYLINNAGFGGQGYFHERSFEQEQSMINLNILALVELTHIFLPDMIQAKSGKILNIASIGALVPGGPLMSVYYATKAFVLSFSYGLAGELSDTNITVTALCPGATITGFGDKAGVSKGKLFSKTAFYPDAVAQDGYNAMMKGELCKVTAVKIGDRIVMKLLPLFPKKIVLKMIKRLQEVR